MNIDLEENVRKGRELIQKGKALGKDIKLLEERVRVLEAQLKEHPKENPDSFPDWYTEEDGKAMPVLNGICKRCTHLLLVKDNSSKHEFKGVWCATFKKKLEDKVESCPGFRPISERLAELIANMKARGELPEWV